jgi:hypothetical protein
VTGQTTTTGEDLVNPTTPDRIAVAADTRQHRLAVLETRARTFTGQVTCVLCGDALNPVEESTRHTRPCRCPDPQVLTPDETIAGLQLAVDVLFEETETVRRRLVEEAERADEAAAMELLARQDAESLRAVLVAQRQRVAWFVQVAGTILGSAGCRPAAETAAAVALITQRGGSAVLPADGG